MQVENPQIVTGKLVKGRKNPHVKIICPHCHLEHTLAPGLRVPPCGSDRAEYLVVAANQEQAKE